MKRLLSFLKYPVLLSIILTGIIFLFIPRINKYSIDLVENRTIPKEFGIKYYDFNNDDESELIRCIEDIESGDKIIFILSNSYLIGQWKVKGEFSLNNSCFFGNYNNDSISEFYLITNKSDSIFLEYFEPFSESKVLRKKFVSLNDGKFDESGTKFIGLIDLNGNGYKELVFMLDGNNSSKTKQVIVFDIQNNTIILNSNTRFSIIQSFLNEIEGYRSGESYSSGLSKEDYGNLVLSLDRLDLLIMNDGNLNSISDPLNNAMESNVIQTKLFVPENDKLFVSLILTGDSNYTSAIRLYNLSGELIMERKLPDNLQRLNSHLLSEGLDSKKLFISFQNGEIYEIDKNLDLHKKTRLHGLNDGKPLEIDVDRDGSYEFIFPLENNKQMLITRNDFSNAAFFIFPNEIKSTDDLFYSYRYLSNNKDQIMFKIGQQIYYYNYYENTESKNIWLKYFGIWVLMLVLSVLFQEFYKYLYHRVLFNEKRIAELTLLSLKNQIDPHFTLNTINTIVSLFDQNETQKANYLFERYSKLLLGTIQSSNKIIIPLKEELEFVQNYLDLEQSRSQNEFIYEIEVGKDINLEIEMPKMLIFTFVENAVKHGIRHKKESGNIQVKLNKVGTTLFIQIFDNGIGREAAKKIGTFGTGKGLIILDEIIGYFYQLKGVKISYKIIDLQDDHSGSNGTIVNLKIPLLKSYFR